MVLWALGVTAALVLLTHYKATPGEQAAAPEAWPQQTALVREGSRAELLLFAHPRCACTRATVTELAKLLPKLDGRARVRVLFAEPEGTAPGFSAGELFERAKAIPGVQVLVDRDGVEAKRFGASASGQVLLYGPDGALLFRGGITAARGHEGDNPGSERIAALLDGLAPLPTAPVFGCELSEAEALSGGVL